MFALGWLAASCAAVGAVAILGALMIGRARGAHAPAAHLHRLTGLPAFARARRRALAAALATAAILALTGAGLLVGIARPMHTETFDPQGYRRDVMLCLDVSGSMASSDIQLLDSYLEMVQRFRGERIGLTVFSSAAVSVFPLTDDYAAARSSLEEARDGLRTHGSKGTRFIAGTNDASASGSSLIGDGLAACAAGFDRRGEDRSRALVFATDNELSGRPLYSLTQAAAVVKRTGARIYTLAPPAVFKAEAGELADLAADSGGAHFRLGWGRPADEIVAAVTAQEAKLTAGSAVTVSRDVPRVALLAALAGVAAYIVLTWRLRR